MRTTLSIDDDVLVAVRAIAAAQHRTIGEVISTLSRTALQPTGAATLVRNGIRLLPMRAVSEPVTLELVNRLRDELA